MATKKVSVVVKNGDINKALKLLKNKTFQSGHLEELRERKTYTKPKTKRRLIKLNAIRNNKRFLLLNQDQLYLLLYTQFFAILCLFQLLFSNNSHPYIWVVFFCLIQNEYKLQKNITKSVVWYILLYLYIYRTNEVYIKQYNIIWKQKKKQC